MKELIAMVFVEDGRGDDDDLIQNKTTKRRIHRDDLHGDEGELLTGTALRRLIMMDCHGTNGMMTRGIDVVEIYDKNLEGYRSLEHSDLVHRDLLKLFGSRLRVRLSQKKRCPKESDILAIEGRYFPYDGGITINGIRIEVEEQSNDPNQGTAGNVWDGAVLLAKFMEKNQEMLRGKSIIELGAGCGLVGIAAGMLGAEQVILTDLPHALPLIHKNIDRHRNAMAQSGCQSIKGMVCDWSQPVPSDLTCFQPNLILVADCVWMQELVAPLLKTIQSLTDNRRRDLPPNIPQEVLISYQRRGKPTHEEFMEGLYSLFTDVKEVDTYATCGLKKPSNLYIFLCQR